jgi:hypothetical protein
MVVAEKIGIEINKSEVCRYLGYGDEASPPTRTLSLINEYVDEAQQIIEPSFSCVIRDIERVEGSRVHVAGSIVFEGETVSQLLENCDKVAVFVSTISDPLEEVVGELAEDNRQVQAAVLDAVGSAAADQVAGRVQERVKEIAGTQGLAISRRFSPGYCGWDIAQQKQVFEALDADAVGIELTDECLMIPRKSVSGIIGIGSSGEGIEDYNPCRTCDARECCPSRR